MNRFFTILLNTCANFNQQKWVQMKYQFIIQTQDVCYYIYKVLDLHAELDLQPPKFEIRKKIKLGLKDHVLDKLIKIFNISTDLRNFIDLVERIDCNFYKHRRMQQ